MTEWREVSIQELCVRVTSGGTPSRKHPEYYSDAAEGVPWVKSQELLGITIRSTDEYISEFGLRNSSAKLLPPGTILMAMYGANVGQLGHLGIEATVNQAICAMVTDPDVTDPRFLYYALDEARRDLIGQAHGAAQQNLSQQLIKPYRLRVPDLQAQRRIGTILGSIDDLVENNLRRVEVLEETARAIYREWFVHFRFPGDETVDLVASDLGPIPDGWDTPHLSTLVATQYGYTESASTEPVGPQYLRGMDINKQSWVDWSTVPYCPIDQASVAKFKIEVGDVFVIRMADPGKVGICEQEVDAVFASYLVRLRPISDRLMSYYLFFTLSADAYQAWVTGASTGSTRKSVSAKVMTEPRIVLPPPPVQQMFDSVVQPIREAMTNLIQQNAMLAALRDKLLPRLVTGQIDVSSLDLDALVAGAVA